MVRLILDRFEDGVAVLTDEECRVYEVSRELLPPGAREDDAFEGSLCGGRVVSLERRENHDAGKNGERLRALFERGKK